MIPAKFDAKAGITDAEILKENGLDNRRQRYRGTKAEGFDDAMVSDSHFLYINKTQNKKQKTKKHVDFIVKIATSRNPFAVSGPVYGM